MVFLYDIFCFLIAGIIVLNVLVAKSKVPSVFGELTLMPTHPTPVVLLIVNQSVKTKEHELTAGRTVATGVFPHLNNTTSHNLSDLMPCVCHRAPISYQ